MHFNIAHMKEEVSELEEEMNAPDFWNDLERSTKVNQRLSGLKAKLNHYNKLLGQADEIEVTMELALEGNDEDLVKEAGESLSSLRRDVDALELETLMRGEYDTCNAILSLHAGAGGTEAQDWAEMLLRMYTRWGEKHGFIVKILDILVGDEAGIKSVTINIIGENAYGYMRSEKAFTGL
jgi:peptide chain release factor 2